MPLELIHLLRVAYRYSMAAVSTRRPSLDPDSPEGSVTEEPILATPPTQTRHSAADADIQITSLKATLEERNQEVESLRAREREARNAANTLQSQLLYARKTADGRKEQCEELVKMVTTLKARLAEVELHARQSDEHAAGLERALLVAREERRSTSVLLETRTSELREAQAYLTKVDDVTDRDVLSILENVNSTMFQTAAKASDAFQARYQDQRHPEAEEAGRRLVETQLLGSKLVAALRLVNHNDDSVLVQTALQGAMVAYTRWLCATWDFGGGSSCLENVYGRVRQQEPQSVSGRWRTMSRTHLKAVLGDSEQARHSRCAGGLADTLTDILLVCGVQGPRQPLLAEVTRVFSVALHEIVRLALEFQRVTGEHIVSRDMSAILAKPDQVFDPEWMVDEWADPRKSRRVVQTPPVLCTTQLGLVREETQLNTKPGVVEGSPFVVSSTLLLKPRVVLVTMLDDLWQEQGGDTHTVE